MKYKVEVGSFCTRFTQRILVINAANKEEAKEKAIEKYCKLESNVAGSVDSGTPQVDNIEEL